MLSLIWFTVGYRRRNLLANSEKVAHLMIADEILSIILRFRWETPRGVKG
ncbi:MAG: hypothetical protein LBK82_14160 [Planctomycetaceae bacterium]|nr:hypothetical protein [Planctomycetaceae bacterium]